MASEVCPVRVAVRIQHHPSRALLLDRLYEGLSGLEIETVTHQSNPPSPWAGYRLCLTDPPDCTHLLIVQDDVTVCRNLPPAVTRIAEANPDRPVCLFLSTLPTRTRRAALQEMKANRRYVTVSQQDFVPVVSVLWPRRCCQQILDWYDGQKPRKTADRSDDSVCGRWMRSARQEIVATLPSLFDHPDEVPSTIRVRRHVRHALHFIGDQDPLDLDWSQVNVRPVGYRRR